MVIFLLSILSSCEKSDPTVPVINPFSNGGNERNMIVVISDLHLGADLTYSETKVNLGPLEKFLKQIKASPNVKELVIAGDMLDEWFVPATINTYQGKDQHDFVQRIANANKGVVTAVNNIIKGGKILVTYIPGNHDLTITAANVESVFPGINQARDAELGLGTYSPAGCPLIAIEHGHRYNFMCAPDPISNQDVAPGTITPPGYFFTRIAALHVMQDCHVPGDTLDVVIQNNSGEESQYLLYVYRKIWEWAINYLPVENKFNEDIIVTNIDGFTGTYSINDLLPYQTTSGGFIDVNLYKGIQDNWTQRQTLNHVKVITPIAHSIPNSVKPSETDYQADYQYFQNPDSDKRIIIFGHSHDPKIISSENINAQKSIYANTGTWIDHNNVVPVTMSFVVVTPQDTDASSQTYVNLYNFENEVVTKMGGDSLRY